MFSVHCPRHGARVLLGLDSIEALVSTPEGIEVHWRCTCGDRGVWLPLPATAASGPALRATTTPSG